MRPAWAGENSFTKSLADSLVGEGMRVSELDHRSRSIPLSADLIFFHWPDEFFYIKSVRQAVKAILVISKLWWAKNYYGQKIVWLVHNLEPHDGRGKSFFFIKNQFIRMLGGVVFLSTASQSAFKLKYGGAVKVPSFLMRHGHYRQDAITAPSMPRQIINGPVHVKYVGRIKQYKSPEVLASTAAKVPNVVRLTIVGEIHEQKLGDELRKIATVATNVSLDARSLSASGFEAEIDLADVIVVAYRDILNSGSALYALSRNRPFVGPRLGSLVELQRDVGAHWIFLYDGEFTSTTLVAAAQWVTETDRSVAPDLSKYDWKQIGLGLSSFLKGL